MLLTNAVCATWFTFLVFAEPVERAHQLRIVEASQAVRVGMTPGEVRAVLGEPNVVYEERPAIILLLKGYRPKQWMYGPRLNLDYLIVPELPFANPLPINLRITEYADEDLVIDWSRNETVIAVKRPEFAVPEEADMMLEAVYPLSFVARSFMFADFSP